jgi:hypothetical protein
VELPQEIKQRIRRRERPAEQSLEPLVFSEDPHILDPVTAGRDQGRQRLQLLLRGKAALSLRRRQLLSRQLVDAECPHRLHDEWQADPRGDVFPIGGQQHER